MRTLGSRGSMRRMVEADIDLAPLMNVFFAIVPMLLLSAVSLQITVIRLGLPSDATAAPIEEIHVPTVRVAPESFTVQCPGLPDVVIARGSDASDGDAEVGDATAQRELLSSALRASKAIAVDNLSVQIQPTSTTRYHEIVWVMDCARDAGLTETALLSTDASSDDSTEDGR